MHRTFAGCLLLLLAGSAQAGFCDSAVDNALTMQRTAWKSKDSNDVVTAALLAGAAGFGIGWAARGKGAAAK